jgi:hypothetical protein
MQRKVLASSLVILCLVLVLLVYAFWPKGTNNLSDQNCRPYLDISSIVKTGDLKSCDCLAEVSQKSLCQNNISNATNYTEAIQQSDLSQCNNIADVGMKTACINITQGKIDFAKQSVLKATSSKE